MQVSYCKYTVISIMIHLYLIMQVVLEGTLYVRRAFIEVAGKGIIVIGSWLLVESMGVIGVMNVSSPCLPDPKRG